MVEAKEGTIAWYFSKEKDDIAQEELNWCSVSLSEVLNNDARLEASVYNIEGRHAREILNKCKWKLVPLFGEEGLIKTAFYPKRFKRIYVEKEWGIPFFLPSQILDIYPKPVKYISPKTDIDIEELRIKDNTLLLTRSGTIGYCAVACKALAGKVFSDDIIRVSFESEEDLGNTYAFIKTKIGNTLLRTNNYGSVISHIEPEHLNNIPIPNPPGTLKKRIHELVMKSYELRDESNELIDKAEDLLVKELELPPIDSLEQITRDKTSQLNIFEVKLSGLNNRLDASYHIPIADEIVKYLKNKAELTTLGNSRVTEKIILAGIFKRIYTEEDNGVPFLGGKEILQLSPVPEKYISLKHHKKRIEKELKIEKNMVLITDRGTIGNVAFVPKHFEGFAVSQNVIKIKLASDKIAGYAFVFLNSEYGKILIKRHTYGSVVDMIDDNCVRNIEFPLLNNRAMQEQINDLALTANNKRYEAYLLEQEAIKLINEEVIYKN